MSNVPSHDRFTVSLSQVLDGKKPVIKDARCEFAYNWDFKTNVGLAHLLSIDGCELDITLHPLGLAGTLAFMSDMPPTRVVINGQRVVLYRIILDIYLSDGERAAAVMFNEDGSVIETTGNWRTTDSAGLAA